MSQQFKFISGLENCHLPGLWSFVISERESKDVGMRRVFYAGTECRMDLWDGADFRLKPHNHRQDIALTRLFGKVENVRLKFGSWSKGEEVFHVWKYKFRSGLIHTEFGLYRQEEELAHLETRALGEPIKMHWNEAHTVTAAPNSAWLVEEGTITVAERSGDTVLYTRSRAGSPPEGRRSQDIASWRAWTPGAAILERATDAEECTNFAGGIAGPCTGCREALGEEVHVMADAGVFHPQCCTAKKHGKPRKAKEKAA